MLGKFAGSEIAIGTRDAFHVACIVAEVNDSLQPGDPVVFQDEAMTTVEALNERRDYQDSEGAHGIVDPFIEGAWVGKGSKVWILLMPNSYSNLRHHFEVNVTIDEGSVHGECGKRCG